MSLTRSEEMHRLTENVYKVSFQRGSECAPRSSGPSRSSASGLRVWWADLRLVTGGRTLPGSLRLPRPAWSPSTSGRPHPDGAAQTRALPQYACRSQHPEGPSSAGPGLLCDLVWSAALQSEGTGERGRCGLLQAAAVGRPALACRGGTVGLP